MQRYQIQVMFPDDTIGLAGELIEFEVEAPYPSDVHRLAMTRLSELVSFPCGARTTLKLYRAVRLAHPRPF